MLTAPYWITAAITAVTVIACVFVHYEALHAISDLMPRPIKDHRSRIGVVVLCLLLVHVAEIWLFGLTYYGLLQIDDFGSLVNMDPVTLFDCVYYSAVVFTTLGFGDVIPVGPIRFLTGMEAVAGLTFITWSASYTIMDMMQTWDSARRHRDDDD